MVYNYLLCICFRNKCMICSQNVSQPLPLAGWICYAEKTLGSYILPYISSVKSPQQAIGAAIKHHVVDKLGLK